MVGAIAIAARHLIDGNPCAFGIACFIIGAHVNRLVRAVTLAAEKRLADLYK